MPTTFGSVAFKTAKASKDADVISLLLKAGAIIIGKANLSVGDKIKVCFRLD
jgi:amidase